MPRGYFNRGQLKDLDLANEIHRQAIKPPTSPPSPAATSMNPGSSPSGQANAGDTEREPLRHRQAVQCAIDGLYSYLDDANAVTRHAFKLQPNRPFHI